MNYYRQYVGLLLQIIYFIANCLAENLILDINYEKPITVISNAFLSFTLDPASLPHNTDTLTKNIERSTNMARGLVPAYIRLGGSQSNSYIFERPFPHNADVNSNDIFSEEQWTLIYQWAKNIGLDIIVCIPPRFLENESRMHYKNSTNITELLSFSDLMGYNVSWQLGYECQTKCNLSGGDLGQYVANFREMLKTFPRYSNSLITGPDIVAYKTAQQQKYLQDYLNLADTALSAITWHPDFASVSLNNDTGSMQFDNMVADENEKLYKIISHTARKKPLWIAESKPEKFKHEYLGALIWTIRLGNVAKLGVQVIMRQPSNFYEATPDYWVSLLHKTLVGRQVLELKLESNNESSVYLYSQCTKPSALYDKGAITVFGVNLTPKEVTANLKDLKIKTLHKYILSPDSTNGNKMFSKKVLLNNKPLMLINDEMLPNLNPEIIINPNGSELKLSSGNIGFWVIPNAKVKACVYPEEQTTENVVEKKFESKRHNNIIRRDNQERKINDVKNDQRLVQGSGRIKRDIGKKLVEIGPRRDNVFKKHSRPFNPRTTNSDENNFYGFFRHKPIKGFPEGDIFMTTGDSSEQNNNDYDYVQEEINNEDDSTRASKYIQNRKQSTQKDIEDNTWVEMENDHVPNEFFENVRLFDIRVKENSKNYGDLLEAEFYPQEHENIRDNNRIAAVKVLQKQLPNGKEEKQDVEKNMQKLVDHYNSEEQEHDRDTKYKALGLVLRRSSMPLSQFVKTPIDINHQTSNLKSEETELKVKESGLEASNFFYQPSQTANFNYNNYDTENTRRHEEINSNKENATNISNKKDNINTETINFSRPDVNSIHEIQDPIFYKERAKRCNRAKIAPEKTIKENEKSTEDCHRKTSRAFQLSKKLYNRRVKRDCQIFADSSSKVESINLKENTQTKRNVENSMTTKEYEEIMTGEILPSTSEIEFDYEEQGVTTESNRLDYKPSYITQTIDVNSTSIIDNSEINNISEQYHNVNQSNIKRFFLVNLEFSPNNGDEDSNNNDIVDNTITKEMFFRSTPSDGQIKATTYDPSQILSKMSSHNENNHQDFVASTTECAQETTRERTQNFINKKEKTDNSIYSTVPENQKDENSMTTEEYEEIMTGEILSSTSEIEFDYEEQGVTTESNRLDYRPSYITQTIDVNSTSIIDNSEINNISEQYHNVNQSNIKGFLVNSEFSLNNGDEDSNNNDIVDNAITKEMFFRSTPSNGQIKATTYDPSQILSKMSSHDENNRQDFVASTTCKCAQETTRERTQNFIDRKEKTDNSIYSTVPENQKDEGRRDNNYKISLNSTNYLETTEKIAEEKMPMERNFLKQLTDRTIDNSGSNESETKSKDHIQQNVEDNQNIVSRTWEQLKKNRQNIDTKKLKSLKGRARYQEYLNKRAEHIKKLKEKLHERQKILLQQYRHELTKIADEQKRNLKKRQTWEAFCENDDFRHPIDQGRSVGNLVDDNDVINNDNNNEKFETPIKFVPKQQYKNIPNRICTLVEVKKEHYPKYDKYYQFPLYVKITENDGESSFVSSDHRKHNQNYEHLPKIIISKQDLAKASKLSNHNRDYQYSEKMNKDEWKSKATSTPYGSKIYANDPSTYRNGELMLQLYENHSKLPTYYSKNDINIEMFKNNKPIKGEQIIDNNSGLGNVEKKNAKTRRDIKQQRLTRPDTRDGSNYDISNRSRKDFEEIFNNKQSIPFYLLTKNDESLLNAISFQNAKNYPSETSSEDLENQQDEKKHKPTNHIVQIVLRPTKDKDSYEILEVKDYDDSLEGFEILHSEIQSLLQKIADSITNYSDDESSKEFVYENLSDLLDKNTGNILDKKVYSSENMQDVSVDVKDSGINHESEKEERYKSEKVRYLGTEDEIRSDKRGMFLIPFPWEENEKTRQRREIRSRIYGNINQMGDEMQSKANRFILTKNIKNEDLENSLNENNIGKQGREKIITEKTTEANYLQTQIDKKNRDNLLEDFIKARKREKNYLYNNKILFIKNRDKDKSLRNNILKNNEKLQFSTGKVISKLQNGIIDSLENTKNSTESVEPFIGNFKEKHNETVLASDEEKHLKNKTCGTTDNPFHVAIINIKEFIVFLSNIFQTFM